jgi:Skp family chaperone for outer membrane proteins
VIDFDRAIADTPEGKDAISKLNALGIERRAAIDTKVKEAVAIENRLRTEGRILSEDVRTQLSQDLAAAQTDIETMQQEAQGQFSKMQAELLGPVEAKMRKAVATYASERGVRVIFDASVLQDGLLYVHDTADITSEIIRRVAANPKTSPGSLALFAPSPDPALRFPLRLRDGKWFDVKSIGAVSRVAD